MIVSKNMYILKKIIIYIIEKVYNRFYVKKPLIKEITTPLKIINPNIFKPNIEYVKQNNYSSLNFINIINNDDNDYGHYIYFED
jgi:hypothetical protein